MGTDFIQEIAGRKLMIRHKYSSEGTTRKLKLVVVSMASLQYYGLVISYYCLKFHSAAYSAATADREGRVGSADHLKIWSRSQTLHKNLIKISLRCFK